MNVLASTPRLGIRINYKRGDIIKSLSALTRPRSRISARFARCEEQVFYLDGGNKRNPMYVNMAEKMMLGDENQLTSWRILGAPSLVDYLATFSFYLDSKVEIASQHLTKVGAFVQGKGQKNFAFNGDVSYKTALAKRVVGTLFPIRENSEKQSNITTKDCNSSMAKIVPHIANNDASPIDLSNGSKNGATHGPKNGPITLNVRLKGTTCVQMFITNSSNVTHIPAKLANYLGLEMTMAFSGSVLVNGCKVIKEVKLLKENVGCSIGGDENEMKFEIRADKTIVSDLERFQVCVEDLPVGVLKVKLGDGTNKGPKNSPLAVIATSGGGTELVEDKKNAVKETFKVGEEEIELCSGLNDGKELRVEVEGGDGGDQCEFCKVGEALRGAAKRRVEWTF